MPESYLAFSWIKIKGIKYSKNIVFDVSYVQIPHDPKFFKIEVVFTDRKNQPCFIDKSLSIREFSSHLNAFNVSDTDQWLCLMYENLICVKVFCVLKYRHKREFVTWY